MLEGYLADYLENFDKKNVHINLMKGKAHLRDLVLSNKLMEDSSLPLRMKFGHIDSIDVEVPSFLNIARSKLTVNVSGVFLWLKYCFSNIHRV